MAVEETERLHALRLLQQAVGDGAISLAEYETRSEALVMGEDEDIARATHGLVAPSVAVEGRQGGQVAPLWNAYTTALRIEAGAWVLASVVCLVVWGAITLTAGPTYFWPIWVIGPWGAVLGARELIDQRMRCARRS